MSAEFPLTCRTAPRCDVRAESSSTNADLRAQLTDPDAWPHLSVLLTENQTAGRGRLDRTWVTPPGSALAISVLLRNLPADVALYGWIPLVAGLAMAEAVAAQMPEQRVGVKWPNDVLVNEQKICGILAEVVDGAVILGAGVNTRMTAEQLPVDTATSFAALGVDVHVDALAAAFVSGLDARLSALCDSARAASVQQDVAERCLSLGRDVQVSLPDGSIVHARAERLDGAGCLVLRHGGEELRVSSGDVVHARLR